MTGSERPSAASERPAWYDDPALPLTAWQRRVLRLVGTGEEVYSLTAHQRAARWRPLKPSTLTTLAVLHAGETVFTRSDINKEKPDAKG